MATTIAVQVDTLKMLQLIKEETKAKNFDHVLNEMMIKVKKPAKSYFGRFKNLGKFEREEIDRFS